MKSQFLYSGRSLRRPLSFVLIISLLIGLFVPISGYAGTQSLNDYINGIAVYREGVGGSEDEALANGDVIETGDTLRINYSFSVSAEELKSLKDEALPLPIPKH